MLAKAVHHAPVPLPMLRSKRIENIYEAAKQTYGAPRIHAELADDGLSVGRKRVEWLM